MQAVREKPRIRHQNEIVKLLEEQDTVAYKEDVASISRQVWLGEGWMQFLNQGVLGMKRATSHCISLCWYVAAGCIPPNGFC